MEYLLRAAPANESIEVTAVRLLNINFAGIHTSYKANPFLCYFYVLIDHNFQFCLYYPNTFRNSTSLSRRCRKHTD